MMIGTILLKWSGYSEQVRRAGAGILAGLAAGLVGGIGSRVAMRMITVAVGGTPGFSIAGTLSIIVMGMLLGGPIGLLFTVVRRYLRGSLLVQGLTFGALLLVIFTFPFTSNNVELARAPGLGLLLFLPLFVLAGVLVALFERPIIRRLPAPRRAVASLAGYGLVFALAIGGMLLYTLIFLSAMTGADI